MANKLSKLPGFVLGLLFAGSTAVAHVAPELISETGLMQEPEVVDCTLENGDAAQCVRLVVKYLPDDLAIGPFCPATISDVGGIWNWDGENPGVYRINGTFLEMLSGQGYQFYDNDGTVHVFDIRVEGPTDAHECIAGSVDNTVQMTVLLPLNPVVADSPTTLGTVAKVGLALDGVPIFADAPSVLDTGHMPALDTCGGHVDPGGWYHWHATATDIDTVFEAGSIDAECVNVPQSQSAMFGYAFDGFAIYGTEDSDGSVPADLDACGGHIGTTAELTEPTYHYHAKDSFPNLPNCLVGVVAQDNYSTTAARGIGSAAGQGGPRGPRGGMPPGFDQAAQALGITPEALLAAMDAAGGPRADLAAVAATLGVREEDLRAVLPGPPN